MWERFSFYGMRSLLVLYMTQHLFLDGRPEGVFGYAEVKGALESVFGPLGPQPLSSQIYGLYTGFVYFTPFFGGILADRVLGQHRSVLLGGVLMAIGHFLMAFETWFFAALGFLVLGNGCFKPNISTQVGALYAAGDPRRDRAFGIFYMGINLGAWGSPLVCGTLGQTLGWHYGFSAAGVGMILGLCIYLAGRRHLPSDERLRGAQAGGAAPAAPLTRAERSRILALVALCALNIVFWAVYEQQGNTMQLWADQRTLWPSLGGWQIPSTWFQSFNPAMIVLGTPLLVAFWRRQALGGREPSSVSKMAIGCTTLGLSFVVMIVAARTLAEGERGDLGWLVGATFLLTLGELYLSPVGLSLVTKLAPQRMVSMLMGMWFLSSFFGNYLSGFIGSFYERMPKEAFFLLLTCLGVGAGLVMWAMKSRLERAIGTRV